MTYKLLFTNSTLQFSRSVVSDSSRPHESQHARPPCPSPTPGVHSDSQPSSQWCHPALSSSVAPFSSCPQSFPASESFPMSRLFPLGSQNIRASAPASVLPVNIQGQFPLRLTGLISLLSGGLSRVFSSTTIQRHQFFSPQLLGDSLKNSSQRQGAPNKALGMTREWIFKLLGGRMQGEQGPS